MKHVLFVCGKGRKRSPTAAHLATRWPGITADFAGLSRDADERITPEHLDWADMVFVMQAAQKKRLSSLLGPPRPGVKVASLDIPDVYEFMQPQLVDLLIEKMTFHFGPPS